MKFGRAAIIALLVACGLGLVWIFTGREASAAVVGNANLIGAFASVLAVALTAVLLWSRAAAWRAGSDGVTADQAQAAVDYLTVETLRYWQIQAKDRRIATPSPAMVSWEWASEDVAAPADLRPAGLTLGLTFGLIAGVGPALELAKAEIVLGLRGRRVRFMPLLETALQRQVLRQAGVVYQFRHAALQDLLASGQAIDYEPHRTLSRPALPSAGESGMAHNQVESAEETGPRSAD